MHLWPVCKHMFPCGIFAYDLCVYDMCVCMMCVYGVFVSICVSMVCVFLYYDVFMVYACEYMCLCCVCKHVCTYVFVC